MKTTRVTVRCMGTLTCHISFTRAPISSHSSPGHTHPLPSLNQPGSDMLPLTGRSRFSAGRAAGRTKPIPPLAIPVVRLLPPALLHLLLDHDHHFLPPPQQYLARHGQAAAVTVQPGARRGLVCRRHAGHPQVYFHAQHRRRGGRGPGSGRGEAACAGRQQKAKHRVGARPTAAYACAGTGLTRACVCSYALAGPKRRASASSPPSSASVAAAARRRRRTSWRSRTSHRRGA